MFVSLLPTALFTILCARAVFRHPRLMLVVSAYYKVYQGTIKNNGQGLESADICLPTSINLNIW